MNQHDLEPLPPELESLLASERDGPGFSDAAQRRMLQRLDNSIAVLSATAPARRAWWSRPGPVGLATFLLGLLLGGGTVARLRPTSAPSVAMSPSAVLESPPMIPPVEAKAAPSAETQAPVAPQASLSERARSVPANRPDERDPNLGAERALLDAARAGVARGQNASALEVLARHAQRFPHGLLSEERDSMWVQALVQAGRYEEARQRASRFERTYPHSMLIPAVEAAVRTIP